MKQVEVVGAVIADRDGRVLCALRSASMSMPGWWEFPGGKLEPGEKPEEALRREIREELGCDIAVGGLIADATHAYPNALVRLMTYDAVLIGDDAPTPAEHERLLWLPPDRLRSLEWAPADLPTVEALEARARSK